MKKILWAVASVILLCNFSFAAEKSGFIFGLGTALSAWSSDVKQENSSFSSSLTEKKLTHSYEALLGYKYFFNENWGLRGYLSYDNAYDMVEKQVEEPSTQSPQTFEFSSQKKAIISNLGLGLDALYNFSNSIESSHGVFLGGNFYQSSYKNHITISEKNKNALSIFANLGYRLSYQGSNFGYALELGAKVPLKAKTELKQEQNNAGVSMTNTQTLKQDTSFYTRLIFSF